MKSDRVFLIHIRECIRRIEENVAGGREEFLASHTIQDAVLRNLQTMAEATQRLSDPLKFARKEIDWRAISAFRNFLVHGYLGIDLDKIWEIVRGDLPGLKQAVIALLEAEG